MPTPENKPPEGRKARLCAIQAPALAGGRALTPEDDRELTRAVFACIGEDITDRTRIQCQPEGTDLLIVDEEVVGLVNWKPKWRPGEL